MICGAEPEPAFNASTSDPAGFSYQPDEAVRCAGWAAPAVPAPSARTREAAGSLIRGRSATVFRSRRRRVLAFAGVAQEHLLTEGKRERHDGQTIRAHPNQRARRATRDCAPS